ncbi:MAG: SAM-dependent methyltransferase [Lacunisphaera sp.]|nr:SAM-dependent methyltransferase [Lacunisphaera sp.]
MLTLRGCPISRARANWAVDYRPGFVEQIAQWRAALRAELAALLPSAASIVWEIGSGHGHFLARYAAEFPQCLCVGVDLRNERLGKSRRKAERARLPNCHFVRAEAREFLLALPTGVAFGEIWALFPDPWPKKRHHKNRLLQPEFFEAVAARAGEGTRWYFRTDHGEYFREVAGFIPGLKTWQLEPDVAWPLEHATVFQDRAASYHSLVVVRTSHPARPVETVAPGLPPPTGPKSPA